jgi:hypothetical protein
VIQKKNRFLVKKSLIPSYHLKLLSRYSYIKGMYVQKLKTRKQSYRWSKRALIMHA